MPPISNSRSAKDSRSPPWITELVTAARTEGVPLVVPRPITADHACPSSPAAACSPDFAAIGAVAGVFGLRTASARYYDGPVSDHFDGTRFFDPHGSPPKSVTTLFRWYTSREKADMAGLGAEPLSATRRPHASNGPEWRLSYVGHASWLLQTAGLNILIDPVWSERVSPVSFVGPKRVNDPGIAFDALPPIDVVLVSHCHYDHLDVETLARLHARTSAARHHAARQRHHHEERTMRRSAPRRSTGTSASSSARGVAVTLVPTRHWSARGLTDRNKALWASFVIETPAGRIYHVADSGYGDGHHFRACARPLRAVPARDAAGRRLRAALVHGRPAHEPGRVGAGLSRHAAPNSRSAITTARSSSPTRRSTRPEQALASRAHRGRHRAGAIPAAEAGSGLGDRGAGDRVIAKAGSRTSPAARRFRDDNAKR